MVVTVFLGVLIAALIFGNILLSLLKPGSKKGQGMPSANALANSPSHSFGRDSVLLKASERERQNMLNKRIDRLEKLILTINGPEFVEKKVDSTVMGKKFSDLNDFRRRARVEIAALKDEMKAVKKKLGVKEKKNPGKEYQISDKKLHDLVFRIKGQKVSA